MARGIWSMTPECASVVAVWSLGLLDCRTQKQRYARRGRKFSPFAVLFTAMLQATQCLMILGRRILG